MAKLGFKMHFLLTIAFRVKCTVKGGLAIINFFFFFPSCKYSVEMSLTRLWHYTESPSTTPSRALAVPLRCSVFAAAPRARRYRFHFKDGRLREVNRLSEGGQSTSLSRLAFGLGAVLNPFDKAASPAIEPFLLPARGQAGCSLASSWLAGSSERH